MVTHAQRGNDARIALWYTASHHLFLTSGSESIRRRLPLFKRLVSCVLSSLVIRWHLDVILAIRYEDPTMTKDMKITCGRAFPFRDTSFEREYAHDTI